VLLVNGIALGANRIGIREVNGLKLTVLQFGFSPVFGALLLAMQLVTQTHYYDQGLLFVPFSLAIIFFAWLSVLGWKLLRGMQQAVGRRGVLAGLTAVIQPAVLGVVYITFLLALPTIFGYTLALAYPVIF
jgi:hypothetical protein